MGFVFLRAAAAAAVLLSAAALIKKRKVRRIRNCAIAGTVLGLLLLLVSLLPVILFTDYEGLETTGEYEVRQTQAILVDESRPETFETDGSWREVPVYFYYPEVGNAGGNGFPLVIFSHGAFGFYQSNTSTYMELASHGYVVVSLDHPYHSFFTRDTEDKLITVNPQFMREVMGINGEDVPQEELLEMSHKWLELRTEDINFVIDSIKTAGIAVASETAGTSGSADGFPAAWYFRTEEARQETAKALETADTQRVGLMGHSLGGAASVTVGRSREDIGAVVDLDGTMLGEQLGYEDGEYQYYEEAYPVPLFVIDNEEHYREGEEAGALYVNHVVIENAVHSEHTYFAGSGHMNFTDLPLFSPVLASLLGTGSVDARECIVTMNQMILNFFDCWLKG